MQEVARLQGGVHGFAGDASLSARREGLRRLVACIQIANNARVGPSLSLPPNECCLVR